MRLSFYLRLFISMQYLTRNGYATKAVPENRALYLNKTLEEKRKLYKCRENYVTLDQIPTWPQYYKTEKVYQKIGKFIWIIK
jgi:hypothetical protein